MFGVAVGHEVVVLDHGAVVEAEAVVGAASVCDGGLFEEPVTGGGFAGVEQSGAGVADGFDVSAREGGDAGESLDEVEGGAFGSEDGAGIAFDEHDDGPGADDGSIVEVDFDVKVRIDGAKYLCGDFDAGEYAFAARGEDGTGLEIGRDEVFGGDVARAEVFLQGEVDQF